MTPLFMFRAIVNGYGKPPVIKMSWVNIMKLRSRMFLSFHGFI